MHPFAHHVVPGAAHMQKKWAAWGWACSCETVSLQAVHLSIEWAQQNVCAANIPWCDDTGSQGAKAQRHVQNTVVVLATYTLSPAHVQALPTPQEKDKKERGTTMSAKGRMHQGCLLASCLARVPPKATYGLPLAHKQMLPPCSPPLFPPPQRHASLLPVSAQQAAATLCPSRASSEPSVGPATLSWLSWACQHRHSHQGHHPAHEQQWFGIWRRGCVEQFISTLLTHPMIAIPTRVLILHISSKGLGYGEGTPLCVQSNSQTCQYIEAWRHVLRAMKRAQNIQKIFQKCALFKTVALHELEHSV
eukprot:1141507-Pelagomonas_calceolata.AAC.5